MPTPGSANAVIAAARSIRSLDIPSLMMQNGTTLAMWEVKNPIVGTALQYFSTSPPDEAAARLKRELVHAEPIAVDRRGETLITVPANRRFGGPSGTDVKGDITFSIGRVDREEDPTVSSSLRSVIGVSYVLDTRPLPSNDGVAEWAAGILEDAVFGVAAPLDRDGSSMKRPSESALWNRFARTPVDAGQVWESVVAN